MNIVADQSFEEVLGLTGEWAERTDAFRKDFLLSAAEHVLEEVRARIPNEKQWNDYRESLQLAQVGGLGKGQAALLIYSSLVRRKVRGVDASETALYVFARRRLIRPTPSALVLERFNPWTLRSLPFVPKRRQAKLVSRKVRRREVERIEKDRKRDASKWRSALAKAGVRSTTAKKDFTHVLKGVDTLPDLAFNALRLEFGLNGGSTEPHWRPAITSLRFKLKELLSAKDLQRTMCDPKYKGWRRPKADGKEVVAPAKAAGYQAFQEALRVRF